MRIMVYWQDANKLSAFSSHGGADKLKNDETATKEQEQKVFKEKIEAEESSHDKREVWDFLKRSLRRGLCLLELFL